MRFVIAALLAATLSACSVPVATTPTTAPSASETRAPAATSVRVSPSLPSATVAAAPTRITDLSQVFHPLATGWRPTTPTLMFVSNETDTSTLVAVPFDTSGPTGPATRILTFAGQGWDLRADGGAIAVQVSSAPPRIATWDIESGTGQWISSSDPPTNDATPVWSKDGRVLYFASFGPDQQATIARVAPDGQGKTAIATLDRFGGFEGLTPDGRGLIWSRGQAGGSAEILDIASGANRHLDDVARIVSWRSRQPRILLSVGGCCAGRPGGSLVAFDDSTMTSRVFADRTPNGSIAFGGAAWDPTGTRIAAGKYDETSPYDATLVILDPESGATRPISDVLGVGVVLWLDEGIIATMSSVRSASTEVVLVPPQGGPSRTLYRGGGIGRIVVIRP